MLDKFKTTLTILLIIVGAVVAFEARYLSAAMAGEKFSYISKELDKKADKTEVAAFRALYIEDRVNDLEFRKFQLERKPAKTSDTEYELQQIKERIAQLTRLASH